MPPMPHVGLRGHAHGRAAEVVLLGVRVAHERSPPSAVLRASRGGTSFVLRPPDGVDRPADRVTSTGDEVGLRARAGRARRCSRVRRGDGAASRGRPRAACRRRGPCRLARDADALAPALQRAQAQPRIRGGGLRRRLPRSRRCTHRARAGPRRRPDRRRSASASATRQAAIVSCSSRAGTTMQASSGTKPTVAVTSPPRRRCARCPRRSPRRGRARAPTRRPSLRYQAVNASPSDSSSTLSYPSPQAAYFRVRSPIVDQKPGTPSHRASVSPASRRPATSPCASASPQCSTCSARPASACSANVTSPAARTQERRSPSSRRPPRGGRPGRARGRRRGRGRRGARRRAEQDDVRRDANVAHEDVRARVDPVDRARRAAARRPPAAARRRCAPPTSGPRRRSCGTLSSATRVTRAPRRASETAASQPMNPAPTTTTRVSGPVTDARSSELAAVRRTRTPGRPRRRPGTHWRRPGGQDGALVRELPAALGPRAARDGIEPDDAVVDDLDVVGRVPAGLLQRELDASSSPRRNSLLSGGRRYGGRSSSVTSTTCAPPPASR